MIYSSQLTQILFFAIKFSISMHQICDGYNPRVRMGNWFQESYSVAQPARTNPVKESRESEIDIGYLDARLKLRPLNRMARLPPWNTSGLVQAPQYAQYRATPTSKENYDLSTTQHYFRKWHPHLYEKGTATDTTTPYVRLNHYQPEHKVFNDQNVSELLNTRPTDTHSFKSQLLPAKHPSQKALLQTTYQKEISQCAQQTTQSASESLTSPSLSNFRRIRSEITLKNVPPFQTYK